MDLARPRTRRTVLRLLAIGAALAAAGPVLGCVRPRPSDRPTDLRSALADRLRDSDPTTAELVALPSTTLDLVATPWLPGWRVVDAQDATLSHPRRVYVALADDGRASVLSGRPEAFVRLVADARPRVTDADAARAVAETFLDVTRAFQHYAYRVARFADIELLPKLDPARRQEVERLRNSYGPAIDTQPTSRSGDGWVATLWVVEGRDLVEHAVGVGPDGALTDRTVVRARDIPVPWSR